MTSETGFSNTPHYVLKSGNQAISPTINFDSQTNTCICVYGFSDKPIYDQFINSATQVLTPYPLVKGYLSHQIAEANLTETTGQHLSLVILDAIDHAQPLLSAATMSTVLAAQQELAKQVAIEFELAYEKKTASYWIQGGANFMPPNLQIGS